MMQLNDRMSDIERQLGYLSEEYVNGVFLDPVDQKEALKAWRNRAVVLVEMMKHSQEQYQRLSSNGLTETQKEFMAQLDSRMSYLKGMLQNIDTIIQKQEGQKQEE